MKRYKAIIFDIDNTFLKTQDMNMYPLIRIIKEETGEDWSFQKMLRLAMPVCALARNDTVYRHAETTPNGVVF